MPNSPAPDIGANVRAEMARHSISQTRLAQELGIPQSSVSSRLRGTTAFKVSELLAIAELVGVPLASLVSSLHATKDAS